MVVSFEEAVALARAQGVHPLQFLEIPVASNAGRQFNKDLAGFRPRARPIIPENVGEARENLGHFG